MTARISLAIVLTAVTLAHADAPRTALWRGLSADALERIDHPAAIARAPRSRRGLDDDLATLVDHATRLVGRICGLRHGVATFVHVENVVGEAHRVEAAAPRLVVLGLRFGAEARPFPP